MSCPSPNCHSLAKGWRNPIPAGNEALRAGEGWSQQGSTAAKEGADTTTPCAISTPSTREPPEGQQLLVAVSPLNLTSIGPRALWIDTQSKERLCLPAKEKPCCQTCPGGRSYLCSSHWNPRNLGSLAARYTGLILHLPC